MDGVGVGRRAWGREKKKKEKFYLGGRTNGSGAVKIARKQSRDKNKQTYACGGGRLDAQ